MIPDLFVEVLSGVFRLDLCAHLTEEGRGFCAISAPSPPSKFQLLSFFGISEAEAVSLMADVEKKGLPPAIGGYYTPCLVSKPPFNHDMLFITDVWRGLDEKKLLGTVYHEACHCFRESKRFSPISSDSVSFGQGRNLRKQTRYHDGDGLGHDDQWFALVVDAAKAMQARYPKLFASDLEVIEAALSADIQTDSGVLIPGWEKAETTQ